MSTTVRASINVAKRGQDGRMRISDAQTSQVRPKSMDVVKKHSTSCLCRRGSPGLKDFFTDGVPSLAGAVMGDSELTMTYILSLSGAVMGDLVLSGEPLAK